MAVDISVIDGVGRINLNRPQAINALTLPMMITMRETLSNWINDDRVISVELSAAGTRGFCSGADVRALRETVLSGGDYLEFFEVEYALDRLIESYPKQLRANMFGITMGGGLGISAHAGFRVAAADTVFAMPETIIGFHPDVGMLFYLSRGPGELGTHLALSGSQFGVAEAQAFGFVDEVVGVAGAPRWLNQLDWIDECYAGDDISLILARLSQHRHPEARAAADILRQRCPMSLAVTLAALRRAAALSSVALVLEQDLVLAAYLIARPDFIEGVRAQLVDKDRQPIWSPVTVAEICRSEIAEIISG